MTLENVVWHYRQFVAGREALTNYVKKSAEAADAMEFRNVTDIWPLFPSEGWRNYYLYPAPTSLWHGATRDPATLHDAWLDALVLAGRIEDNDPRNVRCLVRADGISDKPHTYHVGLVIADDKRRMSPFSQRDFVNGCFSEKNQFQMASCAMFVRQLVAHRASRGADTWLNCDMAALLAFSRGLCYRNGGFGIKDFNQRVL